MFKSLKLQPMGHQTHCENGRNHYRKMKHDNEFCHFHTVCHTKTLDPPVDWYRFGKFFGNRTTHTTHHTNHTRCAKRKTEKKSKIISGYAFSVFHRFLKVFSAILNIEVPPNFGLQEEVARYGGYKLQVLSPSVPINTAKQLIDKVRSKPRGIKSTVVSKTRKISSILEHNSDILQTSFASRMNGKITTHLHIIPDYWKPWQFEWACHLYRSSSNLWWTCLSRRH